MPMHKVTDFLSEISIFFKKNDSDHAMFTIMDVIKDIRMNEWTLFGRKSRCNSQYSLLQVFQLCWYVLVSILSISRARR